MAKHISLSVKQVLSKEKIVRKLVDHLSTTKLDEVDTLLGIPQLIERPKP